MSFSGIVISILVLFAIRLWSKTAFWVISGLLILGLLNISISTAFLVFIVLAIIGGIWQYFDRKKDPEKWAEIDRKRIEEAQIKEEVERPKVAKKYYQEYQDAMKRVPKSEWVLMNREEKSDVFKRRERLKQNFFYLPQKTQELIITKYRVDNRFPNID